MQHRTDENTIKYEIAKVDEARNASLIQVIDMAIPPEEPSGSPRLVVSLGVGVVTLFLMTIFAFVREAMTRISEENQKKLLVLLSYLDTKPLLDKG
jgi:tyrosine-protein kinase Etk/Wzc